MVYGQKMDSTHKKITRNSKERYVGWPQWEGGRKQDAAITEYPQWEKILVFREKKTNLTAKRWH